MKINKVKKQQNKPFPLINHSSTKTIIKLQDTIKKQKQKYNNCRNYKNSNVIMVNSRLFISLQKQSPISRKQRSISRTCKLSSQSTAALKKIQIENKVNPQILERLRSLKIPIRQQPIKSIRKLNTLINVKLPQIIQSSRIKSQKINQKQIQNAHTQMISCEGFKQLNFEKGIQEQINQKQIIEVLEKSIREKPDDTNIKTIAQCSFLQKELEINKQINSYVQIQKVIKQIEFKEHKPNQQMIQQYLPVTQIQPLSIQEKIPVPSDQIIKLASKLTFNQKLKYLQQKISFLYKDQKYSQYFALSYELITHIFTRFSHYYLDNFQKLQILSLISQIIKFNLQIKYDNYQTQEQFILKQATLSAIISKNIIQFDNRLYFQNKNYFQCLRFIATPQTSPNIQLLGNQILKNATASQLQQQIIKNNSSYSSKRQTFHNNKFVHIKFHQYFNDLKFQMQAAELQKFTSYVKTICNSDLQAFGFILLYFQISLKNQLTKINLIQTEKIFIESIQKLQKLYPPNSETIKVEQTMIQSLQNINFTEPEQIFYFKQKQQSNYSQLLNHIVIKAAQATLDFQLFRNLTHDACQEYGHGFKTGLKIYTLNDLTSVYRTVQKLMERPQYSQQFKILKKKFHQSYQTRLMLENIDLQIFVREQIQYVEKSIQKVLQSKNKIEVTSKDLVRGKCNFDSVEDLVKTANRLKIKIEQEGLKLLQLKNRLKKGTKDVVFIIKMPHCIAQFQLAVKLDSLANEFNHKLYEIKRSTLYSPITNVFIQSKRLGKKFFSKLNKVFEQVKQNKKQFIQHQKLDFRQYIIKFNELMHNHIQISQQNPQFQNKQPNQLTQKFTRLINQIQTDFNNLKQSIDKSENQQYPTNLNSNKIVQITNNHKLLYNELIFYQQFSNYSKMEQMLQKIPDQILLADANLLNKKAIIFCLKRNYKQCQECYEKMIQIYSSQMDNKQQAHNKILQTKVMIGNLYFDKGKYQQALQIYRKVFTQYTPQSRNQIYFVADLACNMGRACYILRKYEQSQKYILTSLQMFLQNGKQQYSDSVAKIYHELGKLNQTKSQHEKAIDYFKLSIEINQKINKQHSLQVGQSCFRLSQIYFSKKNYQKAIEFNSKCLEIRLKVLGRQNKQTAQNYQQFGVIYFNKPQYFMSKQYFTMALKIQIQIFGEQHIKVAQTYTWLGRVMHMKSFTYTGAFTGNAAINDLWYAEIYFEKSLKIRQKIYGTGSKQCQNTYNNIGIVNQLCQKYNKAVQFYKKALQIKQKLYGAQSSSVIAMLQRISLCCYKIKQYQQAFKNYKKLIQIECKINAKHDKEKRDAFLSELAEMWKHQYERDTNSQNVIKFPDQINKYLIKSQDQKSVKILDKIGQIYFKGYDAESAVIFFQRSLNIRLKLYPDGHQKTALSYKNLAAIYNQIYSKNILDTIKSIFHLQKSVNLLEKSYEMLYKVYGQDHPQTKKALQTLTIKKNMLIFIKQRHQQQILLFKKLQ